jgi:hypothetical protein
VNPANIGDSEYALLINGRNRYGSLSPIKGVTDKTSDFPVDDRYFQGIYAFDSIVIVFALGKAYVRDFATGTNFQRVPGVYLSETAETIYAEAVPASWMNLQRKLEDGESVTGDMAFYSEIFGTPSAIICQDGSSRPYLIFSVGSARLAKTLSDWNNIELSGVDKREYVPVGKQMFYSSDGILYMVSADGKEIYRSVTGRPLDFVVAVDTNGDKLPALTSGKDEASRLSYKVDFSAITAIKGIGARPRTDTEGEGFYVSTRKKSWIVYPDFLSTVFGEPTFSNQGLFSTGALNQFSIVDILGDTALITESGITSFNSVQQVAVEGKNAPFHDKIFKLFELNGEPIIQTVTATINTDNYAFFAVETVYGAGVLVYDTLRKQYTSLDIYPELTGNIKQFAEVKVSGQRFVYLITATQFVEMFTGELLQMSAYLKEVEAETVEKELIPRRVRVVLENIEEDGELVVTTFTDSKAGEVMTRNFTFNSVPPTSPLTLPFGDTTIDNVANKTFDITTPCKGDRIGLWIQLTGRADIHKVEIICDTEHKKVSQQDAAEIFAEAKSL